MASKTTNFNKKTKKTVSNKSLGTLIGSVLILLVVVVSFVVAPALTDLTQTKMADIELGSYGDEKITFSFLKETPFKRELASLSSNTTDSMDPRLAQAAYKRAVVKAAAIEDFTSNGYFVSKEQLDDAVLNSGYYNVNGSFSSKVFSNTTESQKQELRNNVERELKVSSWQYHTLLQQKRSKKYLEFISSMSNEKRNFNYVTLFYSDYPDELAREYANNNSKVFTKLLFSRITVNDMSKADEILEKVNNKEASFKDLAATYSTDNFKNKEGVMNPTYEYELESIFGITDSADILSLTTTSAPYVVEKDGEIILLTLTEDIAAPDFSNLTEIHKYLLSYERGMIEDHFYNVINGIEDNDLITLGKEIKETGLFSINYGAEQMLSTSVNRVSQDPIFSRAVNNENFFTTLFDLNDSNVSEPIVLGDTISVFKLKEAVSDEALTDDYVLYSLDRALLSFKSLVSEDLIMRSDKFTDNFFAGYLEILTINQGI
ncbi:MAG: hypothetical protein OCD02_09600 [Spirochaetaceae bacterium]